MKYTRLTKEQLEELNPEFAHFLATQSIGKNEWEEIKQNKPNVAEDEIDVFSDVIWDRALKNVKYVDHFSTNYIFLFQCHDTILESIIVKTNKEDVDFFTNEGIEWLGNNLFGEEVTIFTGKKNIEANRNEAVFEIIKDGGHISKGDLFIKLKTLLENK